MPTSRPIRIVVVEDSPSDYDLLLLRLTADGWRASFDRVETEHALRRAVGKGCDLVICDHQLPGFNSLDALTAVRAGAAVPSLGDHVPDFPKPTSFVSKFPMRHGRRRGFDSEAAASDESGTRPFREQELVPLAPRDLALYGLRSPVWSAQCSTRTWSRVCETVSCLSLC